MVKQKSVDFEERQLNFFKWCAEKGIITIDNKKYLLKPQEILRHALDVEIRLISKEYPEVNQFLEKNEN